jgi:hypothetical protein
VQGFPSTNPATNTKDSVGKVRSRFSLFHVLQIIIWGRNEDWLKKTVADIESRGVRATYRVCDVSSRELIYEKVRVNLLSEPKVICF